ncbi:MAG TPA: helix-turn-helix domain-containing protein [Bacteroidia bacterium]|nr:helix-turn-helix domain-containing protein [Bacteroidia bacterium]HNP98327.1 helix-turn-helix domain-containing protein [Bacteroidia bacterium]
MLYIAGISLAFFLSFLLISKKNKSFADKILFVWLLVIGTHLGFFYLSFTGRLYEYPFLIGLQFPFPLLHGPFLYLYAAAITNRLPKQRSLIWIHFIPVVIVYLWLIPFMSMPAEEKISIFQSKGKGHETFLLLLLVSIIVSGFGYIVWTRSILKKHKRTILNQFSNTDKINLDWLNYLMYCIAIIWIIVLSGNDEFTFTASVFFIGFIGYFGIKQVGIFTQQQQFTVRDNGDTVSLNNNENFSANEGMGIPESITEGGSIEETFDKSSGGRRKYSKSGLSSEAANDLHQKLRHLVNIDKVYKDSELTLTELAKKLNTHPNYLSQIINDREGKNFYDFINTLRTEEFKRLISNPGNQKFTLLGLANECGFNSKSSFNKYFRKTTGQSPSEYLEQLGVKDV